MKRNREYFYIAFRVLVILIAIGAGQVLKGLADVMNTTYDGTNYYRAFIISIIIISALIVISIKRMNIKKISIRIIGALIFAISIIYTISKFYYNKNMILGIMISVVFLIELLINEKVDNW